MTIGKARPYIHLFPVARPEEDRPQAVDPEELEDYARKLFQFASKCYHGDTPQDDLDILNSPYNEIDVDLTGDWSEEDLSATYFSGRELHGEEYDYPSGVEDYRGPYTPSSRGRGVFSGGAFSGNSLEIWDREPEGGWQGAFSPRVRPADARYFDADELYDWVPQSGFSVDKGSANRDVSQYFRRRQSLCVEQGMTRTVDTGERNRRGSREGTDLAELLSPRFAFSGTLRRPRSRGDPSSATHFPVFGRNHISEW